MHNNKKKKKKKKKKKTKKLQSMEAAALHHSELQADMATATLAQSILSEEHWKGMCPQLHLLDNEFLVRAHEKFIETHLDGDRQAEVLEKSDAGVRLLRGFFPSPPSPRIQPNRRNLSLSLSPLPCVQTGVLDWGFDIGALASAATSLRDLGWHPVWLVMFDEAWLIASCMAAVFRRTGHPKTDFNADCWAWYLDPLLEEADWEPHRYTSHRTTRLIPDKPKKKKKKPSLATARTCRSQKPQSPTTLPVNPFHALPFLIFLSLSLSLFLLSTTTVRGTNSLGCPDGYHTSEWLHLCGARAVRPGLLDPQGLHRA